MQEEKQKISPIKQRILQFVDTLGISKRDFYAKTGISRGTLESNTGITEDTITKVFAAFPDLNPSWLFIGRDNMLTNQNGGENNCNLNCNPNCNLSPDSQDNPQYPTIAAAPSAQRESTQNLTIYKRSEAEEIQPPRDTSANELVKHLIDQLKEQSEEIGALKQENASLKNQLAERAEDVQDAGRAHA